MSRSCAKVAAVHGIHEGAIYESTIRRPRSTYEEATDHPVLLPRKTINGAYNKPRSFKTKRGTFVKIKLGKR